MKDSLMPAVKAGDAAMLADQLLRMQQENAELKRSNMEKGDSVKKLSVQLTRIKNDWQQQAASGGGKTHISPVEKARAAAAASKEDRISELETELHQRQVREDRMQQQLTLMRQQVGQGGASSRGPVTRQRTRLGGRTPSAPTSRAPTADDRAASATIHSGAAARPTSSNRGAGGGAGGAGGAGSAGGAADGMSGNEMASLLQMLQDKERSIEELRAQLTLHEQANADADAAGAGAAAAMSAATAGTSDGAVHAELQRRLKKSSFEMSLLDQKWVCTFDLTAIAQLVRTALPLRPTLPLRLEPCMQVPAPGGALQHASGEP